MEITGIVLRLTPFREKDAMVNVISPERIYSFLSRGVLGIASKNLASVQPFTLSRLILVKGKEGLMLRSGEAIDSFEKAKVNLSCLGVLSFIGELTGKVLSNDESVSIYPYLHASLTLLNDGFHPLTIALFFFAAILKVSGYGLEVTKCVISGARADIGAISYLDGGFVAKACFDPLRHVRCDERKLKIIRQIFLAKPDDLSRVAFEAQECMEIIGELGIYLEDAAGIRLKSIDLLKRLR